MKLQYVCNFIRYSYIILVYDSGSSEDSGAVNWIICRISFDYISMVSFSLVLKITAQ